MKDIIILIIINKNIKEQGWNWIEVEEDTDFDYGYRQAKLVNKNSYNRYEVSEIEKVHWIDRWSKISFAGFIFYGFILIFS